MFVDHGIRTHAEAKNSADGTLQTRCARCACSESQLGAVAQFGPLKGVGQPTATENQHTNPDVTTGHETICFVVSSMCRRRFEGCPEELICALAPHMQFAGALRYLDQEPGLSLPTVDKLKLQRQPLKGALQALHGLSSNLSFTKSCMSEDLAIVAEKKKFNLDLDALRDYQQRTTARMRLVCRHVSQAMCKKPKAVWVKEMFGDLNTASPAD